MKRFVVLVAVLVTVNGLSDELINEFKEKVQTIGMQCAEQESATDEDIQALIKHEAPVTHGGKCTIFCTMEKLNIIKSDGTIGEGDVEWLNKAKEDDSDFYEKLQSVHESCKETVEIAPDKCDTAFNLAKCAKEAGKKAGIDVGEA
ncbi:general odorant-binding protein 28a [Sitophilus oryzae]|uniref:General odorant-binding protein 28a n=1 Tax=Sitophilus oryzae TaxID=7048 RepID=A0A6J2X2Y8_SITOR|nr:general odorant-binding protein 28a [Sitophilus oryzae]